MNEIKKKFKVLIIGAGCSGLAAAKRLHENNIDFEVFEASNQIGGRIRKLEGFANDFDIELGAEKIHSIDNSYYKNIEDFNNPIELIDEIKNTNYCEYDGKLYTIDQLSNLFPCEMNIFDEMRKNPKSFINESVESYLKHSNFSSKLNHYFKSLMGVRNGGDLSEIDVKKLAEGESNVPTLYSEFTLKGINHIDIIKIIYDKIINKIRFDTPITKLDYSDGGVISVIDEKGNTYRANNVIIAVPISILQNNIINFKPNLTDDYKEAFSKIKMGKGGKLFMKFKERFWDSNTGFFLIDGLITYYRSPGTGKSKLNNILSCLVTGKVSELFEEYDKSKITNILLQDLSRIFPDKNVKENFEDMHYMNWSNEKWIKGTYTFHSVEENLERNFLQNNPLNERIFFAGEYISDTDNGTIHGAIQTGENVADKISQLVKFT